MPATIPVEFTEGERKFADGTREPRLHAFPPGSNVALCGRVKKPGEDRVTVGKHCTTCVQAASRKSFIGR